MRPRLLMAMSVVAMAASCFDPSGDHRELTDGPIVLGPVAYALTPERPLRAPGPSNELCLQVPGDYQLGDPTGSSAERWKIRAPNGRVVSPSVTLVAPDGRREQYPRVGLLFGDGQWVCFATGPPRDTTVATSASSCRPTIHCGY
jgi:hypothetical protein